MKRKVFLHGYLSDFHDGPVEIEANTVAELVEGVTRQLPGFAPQPPLGRHRIKVVGFETEESLYEELGDKTDIHIVPQLNGGKEGGLLQILLGVALVAVGFALGGGFLAGMLIKIGALMVLGGLAQALAPTPDAEDKQQRSRYLGPPENTVKIGTRIGILYGRDRVGGQFLSYDINAVKNTEDDNDDDN